MSRNFSDTIKFSNIFAVLTASYLFLTLTPIEYPTPIAKPLILRVSSQFPIPSTNRQKSAVILIAD